MKKIALFSVLMFAASTMFAQTANPTKPSGSTKVEVNKPKSTGDVKGAGVNNPVGKNGVNVPKPATADKVNTKKGNTTTTTTTNKN